MNKVEINLKKPFSAAACRGYVKSVRRMLGLAVLLALSLAAHNSSGFVVLWWAVGQNATVTDENDNTVSASSYANGSVGAARVRMTDANGASLVLPLYIKNGDDSISSFTDGTYTDEYTRNPLSGDWYGVDWAAAHVDLGNSDTSGYTFVIELGSVDANGSWQDTLAVSEGYSYQTLQSGGYFSQDSNVSPQIQNKWMVDTFTVPEPSVAMLLLLGVELLAFRRGRRKSVM